MNIFPPKTVQLYNGYRGSSPWDGQPFIRNPVGEPLPASMFYDGSITPQTGSQKPQTNGYLIKAYVDKKRESSSPKIVTDPTLYHQGVPAELKLYLDKESMGGRSSGLYMQNWLISMILAAEESSKQKKEFKHMLSFVKSALDSHWSSAYLADAYREYIRVVRDTFVPTPSEIEGGKGIQSGIGDEIMNGTGVHADNGAKAAGGTLVDRVLAATH